MQLLMFSALQAVYCSVQSMCREILISKQMECMSNSHLVEVAKCEWPS